MWHYRAPVADMLHLMTQALDAPASWAATPAFDGLDAGTAGEVLDQAARVADDVLAGVGHALLAWAWARIARVALDGARAPAAGGRSADDWCQCARFGVQWPLPQAQVHWQRARQPALVLPGIDG